MKVLVLGWEFPPLIRREMGRACYRLSRAMTRLKVEPLLLLPMAMGNDEGAGYVPAGTVPSARVQPPRQERHSTRTSFRAVPSWLSIPYEPPGLPSQTRAQSPMAGPSAFATAPPMGQLSVRLVGAGAIGGYDGDLTARIGEYANRCARLNRDEQFDVIHPHDWMTFPAGIVLAAECGRPLVVQVHAMEFDRSGEHVNWAVYNIERQDMHAAATIIAVSHLTKRIIVERYGVTPERVQVIHNGIKLKSRATVARAPRREKIVLCLGCITVQKGLGSFVKAAARVLEKLDNVKFIMAG